MVPVCSLHAMRTLHAKAAENPTPGYQSGISSCIVEHGYPRFLIG